MEALSSASARGSGGVLRTFLGGEREPGERDLPEERFVRRCDVIHANLPRYGLGMDGTGAAETALSGRPAPAPGRPGSDSGAGLWRAMGADRGLGGGRPEYVRRRNRPNSMLADDWCRDAARSLGIDERGGASGLSGPFDVAFDEAIHHAGRLGRKFQANTNRRTRCRPRKTRGIHRSMSVTER